MTRYKHSMDSMKTCPVPCSDCGLRMTGIYSPDIRETCTPCGGFAKKDSRYDFEHLKATAGGIS